jgi:hypothetical protein
MGVENYQTAPEVVAKRRMRTGHILRHPVLIDGTDNLYHIKCEGDGCGWFSAPFMKGDEAEGQAEYAAYLHRTSPDLLVSGSSDTLPLMRRNTVDEMLAKLRAK